MYPHPVLVSVRPHIFIHTYSGRDSPWAVDSDLLESRNSHFLPVSGEICPLIWIQSFLGVAPGYCLRRSKAESRGRTVGHFLKLHTKRRAVRTHLTEAISSAKFWSLLIPPPSSRQLKLHTGGLAPCTGLKNVKMRACVCRGLFVWACLVWESELSHVCLHVCIGLKFSSGFSELNDHWPSGVWWAALCAASCVPRLTPSLQWMPLGARREGGRHRRMDVWCLSCLKERKKESD